MRAGRLGCSGHVGRMGLFVDFGQLPASLNRPLYFEPETATDAAALTADG